MEEKDEWIPYQELDFDCLKNNNFWIDTRDFHAGYKWEDKPHKDIHKLKKYDSFFFTKKEVVELLDRLFKESGGVKDWRFLSLEGLGNGWELKYIRIQRIEDDKFLICDSDWKALRKEKLDTPVLLEFL